MPYTGGLAELRPVWTRGPWPNRFAAVIKIRRERMVLEAERQRRPGCMSLVRVRDTHAIVGLYRLAPADNWNGVSARYAVVCELHGTRVEAEGFFGARTTRRHPRAWCEPCSRINVLLEGIDGEPMWLTRRGT